MMDSPTGYPESPMEQDDAAYPCKGCGEILDEGKAFELAGNRWHIDCFRCNTCATLLDSDANLLLLGDGSLICNNCTYSCSACNNKIEDLAILTGDQAFCASCFRCRNCKKKIENLKYARTSQGIFCMACHDSLMQRRRKKTGKHGSTRHKHTLQQQHSSNTMLLHKSLPSLPPNAPETTSQNALLPENESPPSDGYSDTPTELPRVSRKRPSASRSNSHNGTPIDQSRAPPKRPPNSRSSSSKSRHQERAAPAPEDEPQENLTLPSTKYNSRHSAFSHKSDAPGNGEDFFISMALDPNVVPGPSPMINHDQFNSPSAEKENMKPQAPPPRSGSRDYFSVKGDPKPQKASNGPQSNHADSHPDSPRDSGHSSQPSSPHIAYQELGRDLSSDAVETARKWKENGTGHSLAAVANDRPRGESPHAARSTPSNDDSRNGKFMLQEVPKGKKSGGSRRNSQSLINSNPEARESNTSKSAPPTANAQVKEQQVAVPSVDSPHSLRPEAPNHASPRAGQESRSADNGTADSSTTHSSPMSTQLQNLPQRGDSLLRSKHPTSRKENLGTTSASKPLTSLINDESEEKPLSTKPAIGSQYVNTPVATNGTPTISKQKDLSESGSLVDVPHLPLRARDRDRSAIVGSPSKGSFVAPRQSPYPPTSSQHKPRNESISTLKSESTNTGDQPGSPKKLPPYSAGQEFTMDEDMARILGNEEQQNHESFLRRVSNSVRHARSYSDRGTRLSKDRWPRSPLTASSGFAQDVSSPTPSSPETREELIFLKNELRRERQKSVEKEHRLAELETALEAKSSITQMNTELREKRSTMIVLDTQKEIVVRELEVLTEHIAESKKSREPLDLNKMSNAVLREFAESLQKLKESFTPQIEDLTQKRNELVEEVSNLTQLKDRNFQEFEQVSTKNAQLMELNNMLVHQVQELYKANASPSLEVVRPTNGLGIYSPGQKDTSAASFDQREMRPSIADSNATSATLVHEQAAEPAAYVTAPQVVNIRKGQPKKFNWKKGGHNVVKVTKGLKGAFSSSEGPKPPREEQYPEGMPYNSTSQGHNAPSTDPPRNHHHDPSRQGFGFFSNQKGRPPMKTTPNGSVPALNQTVGVPLFGSELQHRADYEASDVPSIVMRCIQEVEVRGMEIEGIYRKSGGNSQIQQIKEGFERTNDYDVSDPDLDINAVTSTLKQYFRKLPTPLITYDVYDRLLNSIPPLPPSYPGAPLQSNPNHNLDPEQREHRIGLMRQAIGGLPAIHRTCLEVLVFHLARVVEHEKLNLMTSLNVAVVFAPTVMRPESLAREMSENQAKNQAVQFLIENCHGIFLGDSIEKGEL
ncbi:MAG: hypothetical protein L6R38_000174 [Xanthoria sp. 2 TBL-2021]|nr:MAG: hypothetical protein L6R38_000174 [Xanthoria sp. 2 TBL-2021]